MDDGVFVSTALAETITLAELLERYKKEILPTKKSQRQVISQISMITKELGNLRLTALTPEKLANFRDHRLTTVSGHTVRKDLLLLSRALNHAMKEWSVYLPRGNPIGTISIPSQPKGRTRRLVGNEEELLLQEATNYGGSIYDIIIIAIETGLRRSEIVNLHWEDINLHTSIALIRETKNGDDRRIPLSTKAKEVFERHLGTDSVFDMLPDSITRAFVRICKRAEIDDLRFHDLRHEATSRFFEKGLSIMEVSSITGHKDLAMLRSYTHLKAEDLVDKLG